MPIDQVISPLPLYDKRGASIYATFKAKMIGFHEALRLVTIPQLNTLLTQLSDASETIGLAYPAQTFTDLLTVDAFKYTKAVDISGSDLNNLTLAGFYGGSSLINSPTPNLSVVTSERYETSRHQMLTDTVTNITYTRTYTNGTLWSTWGAFIDTLPVVVTATDKGIFGYGWNGNVYVSMTNLVSNTGVVSADVAGVGTARNYLAACSYGGDKGIFGYGYKSGYVSMTNLVSNTGVVSADVAGVGTARGYLAACSYGTDKGIFGYGGNTFMLAMTNLVSNTGVVSADVTVVGTVRNSLAACGYGTDKGIFGYGYIGSSLSLTNLVSNTGVVSADVVGVGTARYGLAACGL